MHPPLPNEGSMRTITGYDVHPTHRHESAAPAADMRVAACGAVQPRARLEAQNTLYSLWEYSRDWVVSGGGGRSQMPTLQLPWLTLHLAVLAPHQSRWVVLFLPRRSATAAAAGSAVICCAAGRRPARCTPWSPRSPCGRGLQRCRPRAATAGGPPAMHAAWALAPMPMYPRVAVC